MSGDVNPPDFATQLVDLGPTLLSQFDAEEGWDAGVQIERFAGPAGSDDAGLGVLEAVYVP